LGFFPIDGERGKKKKTQKGSPEYPRPYATRIKEGGGRGGGGKGEKCGGQKD